MLNGMKVLIISTILLITILRPSIANPQAIRDATEDAKRYNPIMWGAAGCFSGLACVLPALIVFAHSGDVKPKPSPERLMGKTPDYVQHYTDTYTDLVKKEIASFTKIGALIGTGTCLCGGTSIILGGYLLIDTASSTVGALYIPLTGCGLF